MTDLARTLCWQHFDTYRSRWPLNAPTARYALEPLVNIARLLIRARDTNGAHHLLESLIHAVSTHGDAVIDGRSVSFRHLTGTQEDHRTLRQWLWTVMLADGTRALTSAGQWQEALAHVQQHKGIGRCPLDGRQVAVLAHLHANDPDTALKTLSQSVTTGRVSEAGGSVAVHGSLPPAAFPGSGNADCSTAISRATRRPGGRSRCPA
ncbi:MULTISPECIES: hypothetical protein [Actinomadura]|uniref:Uncharacterized protein n=1 Tax=Actinomadura yumaensis TaxID=111807 RepID=A0ABW2CIC4_9ACTN|nr:hypothetical protein [Actinomadura sp. J1-007]MWK37168.1 hypothetical protein [Actinomadura sp. J1-007]